MTNQILNQSVERSPSPVLATNATLQQLLSIATRTHDGKEVDANLKKSFERYVTMLIDRSFDLERATFEIFEFQSRRRAVVRGLVRAHVIRGDVDHEGNVLRYDEIAAADVLNSIVTALLRGDLT